MSTDKASVDRDGHPADNSRSWPGLASMLAPDGGCECQMLALMIAEGFGTTERAQIPTSPPIAKA